MSAATRSGATADRSPGEADATPEVDLGWALTTIARELNGRAAAAMAGLPGGPRGYLVLSTVTRGRARSQLALAQQLGVDKTVMTYLLDDLEKSGLLERLPDPADRRARQIAITEKGSAEFARLSVVLREVEEDTLAALSKKDAARLRELLTTVAYSYQAVPSCTVSDVEPGTC